MGDGMSLVDDRRPADELDGQRALHAQFKAWRERDWFVLGYPPQRPSPYWFALATDAVWMTLLLMEQGLGLMQRMTAALEHPVATPLSTQQPSPTAPKGAG
jgi:hypothetical protein